jgi:sugar phosphate isomerase/epimerase
MILSGPLSALRKRFGDEKALIRMAKAGFDAADYTFNEMVQANCVWNTNGYKEYAAHLNEVAADSGIFFNQAHAPFLFDWENMWLQSGFEEIILPTIERSFACASLLKIPLIVVHPIHHITYYGNEEMLLRWNLDYYKRLLPVAKNSGLKIALENMWQQDLLRDCGSSDVFSHPELFRDFLEVLQDPAAVACVDVGHAGLSGEDPARMLRILKGHVKALHLHDNFHKVDDHTLPYLGKLDWEAITKALGEIGYDGDFTYEVTNYVTPFPDSLVDDALAFQVTVGRSLIQKILANRK